MTNQKLPTLGEMSAAMDNEVQSVSDEVRVQAHEIMRKTQPLYVLDAERVVLGSLFCNAEKAIAQVEDAGLKSTDFYVEHHRFIFDAIVALHGKGRLVDVITVSEALNRQAKLEQVGGPYALSSLESLLPSAAAAGTHAEMIIEKARLRSVATAAAEALQRARLGHRSSDVINGIEVALDGAQRKRGSSDFVDLNDLATETINALPAFGAPVPGISTGFLDVNKMFRFVPGDLVIVAARPSMGKTQFVLDCLRETTIKNKEPAVFFSLEMSGTQIMNRMLGSKSGIDLKRTSIPGHEKSELADASAWITGAPLFIDDSPSVSIGDIRSKARSAHRSSPLKLVVVDYIQLMDIPDSSGNLSADVGLISKGLKRLARELGCAVIALSQLNRGVESRSDKRPLMSDLRESGNLEQDADVIAFLYREEYYAKEKTPDELKGVAEILVAKNRNGPTGSAKLRFETNIPRFTNLATEW